MPAEPPTEQQPGRTGALLPVWLWIVLAVVLLFSSVTFFQARRTTRRLAELESQLGAERERTAQLQAERKRTLLLTAIVSSPDTRQFTLFPLDAGTPVMRVYWHEKLGIVLSAPGAPPPKPGRIYQFWIINAEGQGISVGIFAAEAASGELQVFPFAAKFSQATALIVTDELARGSLRPSPPALWQRDLKRQPIILEPQVEPPGSW